MDGIVKKALGPRPNARGRAFAGRFVLVFAMLALSGTVVAQGFRASDAATSVTSSSTAVPGRQVRDQAGHAVTLPTRAERIVSLLPSLTETVCVLGACDRLVGTDRWSDWPKSVQALPKLGGLEGVQLERLLQLKPDLVLVARSSRLASRLRNLGLAVAEFEPTNLVELQVATQALAVLLDTDRQPSSISAIAVIDAMEQSMVQHAKDLNLSKPGPLVYLEVDDGLYAAGPSSYLGELLHRLGARNVASDGAGPFPKLSPEVVVRADPDVIIVSERAVPALRRRPGWLALRALQTQERLCAIPEATFTIMGRPGPRLELAMQALSKCLKRSLSMAGGQGALKP